MEVHFTTWEMKGVAPLLCLKVEGKETMCVKNPVEILFGKIKTYRPVSQHRQC